MQNYIARQLELTIVSTDPNGYARTKESFNWSTADGRGGESKNLTVILEKWLDCGLRIDDVDMIGLCNSWFSQIL